jgi:hypothetical protein|tara:strand:+ start:440 stop:1027 length:588 start_codon:yes stop_codon:yes gene_type:complete
MINAKFDNVKTVLKFHKQIVQQQEEAHGEHYCAMHKAIQRFWAEGKCKTYMELGVHQGGTAANAMMLKPTPEKITLIDIDMAKYNSFLKPIAEKHCKWEKIELDVRQTDSTGFGAVENVDMLVIDSVHKAAWMSKELDLHGKNVRKYIIAHDTMRLFNQVNEQLHTTLTEWGDVNGFRVVDRGEASVGYTVIMKD